MVHPDAKRWFVNSNFHKTDNFKEFLNDAMTYAFVRVSLVFACGTQKGLILPTKKVKKISGIQIQFLIFC